jgi:hypothetical protein
LAEVAADHNHSGSDRIDSSERSLVVVLVEALEVGDRARVAVEDVVEEEADVLEEELDLDHPDPDSP